MKLRYKLLIIGFIVFVSASLTFLGIAPPGGTSGGNPQGIGFLFL